MNFGDQIKTIRETQKLTQEQLSQKLNVSRQAVSNWENDRNLPDIEMLITIANVFHISLDQLILGGNDRNKMTEKLIKDGSETKRAKANMISVWIGAALLLIGLACIWAKSRFGGVYRPAGNPSREFFSASHCFSVFIWRIYNVFCDGSSQCCIFLSR